ncbi:CorA family divalent cation transporter [Leucobacter luti]|uniref:Magnesium transporter n=1 Tax=Leucobacter luti TaxID=340320 RepID=A0A4Q7TKE4_9MICO|nr:CorA family divalent cation transporter [Leucobacter luti]MBL3700202.1 magnesium transporter [Leucobacter luti]RZT61075.1 magnesium transporter [Leucobacter luti]
MTENTTGAAQTAATAVAELPRTGWLRVRASDRAMLANLERQYGLELHIATQHPVYVAGFTILPIELPLPAPTEAGSQRETVFESARIVVALTDDLLITVEPDHPVAALATAQLRVEQLPEAASSREALLLIIDGLNDAMQNTVDRTSLLLNQLASDAVDSSGGYRFEGRQVGVADIAQTAVSLGGAEELIARTVQGQLMLERAARRVRRASGGSSAAYSTLLSDIQGGRRHARFQHSKVRNIQQSLMTTLDLKQNQIIKVFTVVTAVFTPPTLIAAYYGQNFANMPELALPWGEWFVMGTTAVFALVPLAYIKRKRWLR